MKRVWCRIVGHDEIPVREVGLMARPGGMLPSLDGVIAYEPHPEGRHRACRRCRAVTIGKGKAVDVDDLLDALDPHNLL